MKLRAILEEEQRDGPELEAQFDSDLRVDATKGQPERYAHTIYHSPKYTVSYWAGPDDWEAYVVVDGDVSFVYNLSDGAVYKNFKYVKNHHNMSKENEERLTAASWKFDDGTPITDETVADFITAIVRSR